MRTRIYVEGVPGWSESTPAYARTSGWSGSSIVDAIPSLAPVTRTPKVPEVPDYVARAAKGWETRRENAAPSLDGTPRRAAKMARIMRQEWR